MCLLVFVVNANRLEPLSSDLYSLLQDVDIIIIIIIIIIIHPITFIIMVIYHCLQEL